MASASSRVSIISAHDNLEQFMDPVTLETMTNPVSLSSMWTQRRSKNSTSLKEQNIALPIRSKGNSRFYPQLDLEKPYWIPFTHNTPKSFRKHS